MSAFLTVDEVAERMRCEHRTVRRAIHAGELEAAMIGGKWLVREEAVDAWFEARAHRAKFPVSETRQRPPRAPSPAGRDRVGSRDRLKAMEGGRR